MSLTVGQIVGGHYKIAGYLGGGGFGETYLAIDLHLPDLPTRVVKRMKIADPDPEAFFLSQRLFETEAQVLYKLGTHDRIPQLFAHFEEEDNFYLVQEFIDGQDLGQEVNTGIPLSESQTINILQGILEVLQFVHQNNVIHRDIKPENIIRRKGDRGIVLIDFGIVKQINRQLTGIQSTTNLTVAVGTFGFMPSEQASGDPRLSSDIYAVGIIGIQALTGLQPQQLRKNADSEIVWRDYANVSLELAEVLSKMVRYDFRMRYPSATEALQALGTVRNQANISTQISGLLPTAPLKSISSDSHPKLLATISPRLKLWLGIGAASVGAIALLTLTSKFLWPAPNSTSLSASTSKTASPSLPEQFSTQVIPNVRFKLSQTIVAHAGYVHAVALSPNQKILASGGADKTIRFWDMSTAKPIRTLLGHSDRVYDLTFSPNGKLLASGGADNTVRLWDAKSGNLLKTLNGHSDRVYTVIFSPDGKLIASSSDDKTIKLWNVATGKLVLTLTGHSDRVNDMAFSPTGETLASGSGDSTIKLWDVATGQILSTLSSNSGGILSLVYSPDGKMLATGVTDNTIRLWDLQNGKVKENVLTGHTKDVHTLAFSNDGKLIASGSADNTIRVWNLDLRQSQVLSDHRNGVASVIFSNDDKLIISGSLDRTIKIWKREP